MSRSDRTVGRITTIALLVLITLLILQALGYGIGFFLDPESGVGEFASPPPAVPDDLTVALVGLVGVSMIGTATMLAVAAVLVLRRNRTGALVSLVVGAAYVLAGASALRAGWEWDAGFYAGTGALLMLLSFAVYRTVQPRPSPTSESMA